MVFLAEAHCVLCEVRTAPLYSVDSLYSSEVEYIVPTELHILSSACIILTERALIEADSYNKVSATAEVTCTIDGWNLAVSWMLLQGVAG